MNEQVSDVSGEDLRSGIVAVVGRANVGKSTLINRMVGEKVSIVSPIAQTTRNLIRAILADKRGQVVFLDTPGVHKASYDLGRIMNRAARKSTAGSDLVLLVINVSEAPGEEDAGWISRLTRGEVPWAIVANQVDLGARANGRFRTLVADSVSAAGGDVVQPRWFEVSAKTGDGVEALVDALFETMPVGPALFPEDILTDFPRNWAIADVVREKFYAHLKDELPHAVAVEVDKVQEEGDKLLVDVLIYVNKPSQKGIVIGHRGRLMKLVKREAEVDLSEMFDCQVKLHPWVKVHKDWAKNPWILEKLGYIMK
jgi:GTP-binding protein Era